MNCKLLSVLVATGVCCIANPVSTMAMGNGAKQPNPSVKAEERDMIAVEKFKAMLEESPPAAGQPQEATRQNRTRNRLAPSGTWTWKGGITQERQ